jgi:hypothetical protein
LSILNPGEKSIMFLAQNVKKFLKETFQVQKNTDMERNKYRVESLDESDPGLFNNNDLIGNPAYSGLLCNIYHDDLPLDKMDEN